MFETFKNGITLGSQTRKLVFQDKRLLVYPILMGVIGIVEFIILFLGGVVVSGGLAALESGTGSITGIVVAMIIFYFVSAFTATYLTIAMLLAFRGFVGGKEIGFGEALGQAGAYATLALEWSIFYTTVALLLNLIESRFRGVANLAIGVIGSLALSVAIMFAVPAIIDKNVGPIGAVKESVSTITKHFGATFGGLAYTELYGLAFTLLGILVLLGGSFAAGVIGAAALALIVIGIVLTFVGSILSFTLSNVFKFMLYEYINGKPLPKGIDESLIKKSIKTGRGTPQI